MTDAPPLSWFHTFEPGPDFMARITHPTGLIEDVARIYREDTTQHPLRWKWSMLSIMRFVGVEKPAITMTGNAETKAEAVAAVRAAWEREAAWRAGIRAMPVEERTRLPRAAVRIAYGCGWAFAHEGVPLPAEALGA